MHRAKYQGRIQHYYSNLPCSSCVRIVSSDSGMGKSLCIQSSTENLKEKSSSSDIVHISNLLHGPVVTPDTMLTLFKDHFEEQSHCIEIDPSVCVSYVTCSLFFELFL